jgi:uncharacterized membrane protein YgdD (TMEM256/DUF423 family)
MTDQETPSSAPERLLRAIRIARGVLLFSMFAAVMLVAAAVIVPTSTGLALAAKLAALGAALVALSLLALNLLAIRAWRRGRRSHTRD